MLFILMDKFCVGMVVKLLSCKYCWGNLVLCLFSLVSILFCWHWASGTVYGYGKSDITFLVYLKYLSCS